MTRERTKKAEWEKQKVQHEKECKECRLGCIVEGKCQKPPITADACHAQQGEFCQAECTATDGKHPSAHYPCACGKETCSEPQICDAHLNKCKVNFQESVWKKQEKLEKTHALVAKLLEKKRGASHKTEVERKKVAEQQHHEEHENHKEAMHEKVEKAIESTKKTQAEVM